MDDVTYREHDGGTVGTLPNTLFGPINTLPELLEALIGRGQVAQGSGEVHVRVEGR